MGKLLAGAILSELLHASVAFGARDEMDASVLRGAVSVLES